MKDEQMYRWKHLLIKHLLIKHWKEWIWRHVALHETICGEITCKHKKSAPNTAKKLSVFGVIMVLIFPHSD